MLVTTTPSVTTTPPATTTRPPVTKKPPVKKSVPTTYMGPSPGIQVRKQQLQQWLKQQHQQRLDGINRWCYQKASDIRAIYQREFYRVDSEIARKIRETRGTTASMYWVANRIKNNYTMEAEANAKLQAHYAACDASEEAEAARYLGMLNQYGFPADPAAYNYQRLRKFRPPLRLPFTAGSPPRG